MSISRTAMAVGVALLAAAPLLAQGGNPGGGVTPMGNAGYGWQTEQNLAQEAQRRLEAKLEGMSEDEWKQEAVAWFGFEVDSAGKGGEIRVTEAFHVANLKEGKTVLPVENEYGEIVPGSISFNKKLPRSLKMVLTDNQSTEVTCDTRDPLEAGSGHFGVFLDEGGVVLCMPRTTG